MQGRTQGSAQCHAGEANSGTRRKTVASPIARPHTPHTSRPECGKSPVTQHHYSRLAAPSSASHRRQLDLHTTASYACQPTRPHCAAVQPQESARAMKPQLGSLKPRGAAAASARCVSEPTADVPYCWLARLLSGNWLPVRHRPAECSGRRCVSPRGGTGWYLHLDPQQSCSHSTTAALKHQSALDSSPLHQILPQSKRTRTGGTADDTPPEPQWGQSRCGESGVRTRPIFIQISQSVATRTAIERSVNK